MQNYQLADKILPQTHALRLPSVVCGCTRALQIAFLCAQTVTMAEVAYRSGHCSSEFANSEGEGPRKPYIHVTIVGSGCSVREHYVSVISDRKSP